MSEDNDDDPVEGSAKPSAKRAGARWSAQEKLEAVVEAGQLNGAALGEYLRRRGLHQAEVEQWRAEATEALEPGKGVPLASGAERRRIKELERELRRKDKALAETAALLVLRKKFNALWGVEDDDTDKKNEP